MTATVVLVHGAFSGAWTWRDVRKLLDEHGVPNHALDLPTCYANDVSVSFLDDANSTRRLIDEIAGPVVLVGNSYGGVVISQAAAGHPFVKRLVYLAAFMPLPGESLMMQMLQALQIHDPSEAGVLFRSDGLAEMDLERDIPFSYQQAPPEQLDWIRANPPGPMSFETNAAAAISAAAWQTIPSTYVVCDDDRSIRPDAQRQWAKERATDFVEWPSDHCPQHSRPDDVADLLAKLANDI